MTRKNENTEEKKMKKKRKKENKEDFDILQGLSIGVMVGVMVLIMSGYIIEGLLGVLLFGSLFLIASKRKK